MGGVHPRVLEVPRDEREWERAHINTHEPKAPSHPAVGKEPPVNGRRSPKGGEARSRLPVCVSALQEALREILGTELETPGTTMSGSPHSCGHFSSAGFRECQEPPGITAASCCWEGGARRPAALWLGALPFGHQARWLFIHSFSGDFLSTYLVL